MVRHWRGPTKIVPSTSLPSLILRQVIDDRECLFQCLFVSGFNLQPVGAGIDPFGKSAKLAARDKKAAANL